MIPKIIHFCWFGKGEKTELTKKCMESWKKYFPDYQLIEWNEDNIDLNDEIPYVQEAYRARKYAFVSDYIRLKALLKYGGVYFDTDYEVLKPMTQILQRGGLVTGFESRESILTAMIAVEKGNPLIEEFVRQYKDRHFILESGVFDTTPINVGFSKLLEKYGVDLKSDRMQVIGDEITIYPVEVLCGFSTDFWHEVITEDTVGVHHMSNSWATPEMKKHIQRIQFLQRVLGIRNYDRLKTFIKRKNSNE